MDYNNIEHGTQRQAGNKVDPSFKSKRYRDKLRAEVKALENLLPVIKPAISRKLDSQTIYRITLAYLRIKAFFKAIDALQYRHPNECEDAKISNQTKEDLVIPKSTEQNDINLDHLTFQQSLDGCILVVSADGTIMYATENVQQFLGFQQVDLIHRCLYGIVHPVDQSVVRDSLECRGEFSYQFNQFDHWPTTTTTSEVKPEVNQCEPGASVPFSCYCRLRCFNKHGTAYSKFHISGKIQHVPNMPRSTRTCSHVALLYCRPFLYSEFEIKIENNHCVFGSKHDLDLKFQDAEDTIRDILGYEASELCKTSLYQIVHPDDLCLMVHVHRTILDVNEVQSFYLRLQNKGGNLVWLHCKGKVICKNSKKFSIVFTHRPLRDEDITFIDHETTLRRHFSANNLMTLSKPPSAPKHLPQTTCSPKNTSAHGRKTFLKADTLSEYSKAASAFEIHKQLQPYHIQGHHQDQDIKTLSKTNTLSEYSKAASVFENQTHLQSYYTQNMNSNNSAHECYVHDRINQVLNNTTYYFDVCPSSWHANSGRHSPVLPSCHTAPKIPHRDKYRHLIPNRMDKRYKYKRGKHRYVENYKATSGTNVPMLDNVVDKNFGNQIFTGQQFPNPEFEPGMGCMTGPRLVSGFVPTRQFPYISPFHPYPPSPPPSPRSCVSQYWGNTQTRVPAAAAENIPFDHHGNMDKGQGQIESHASFTLSMVCNTSINSPIINRPWCALQMAQDYPTRNGTSYHDNGISTTLQNMEQVERNKFIKTEPYTSQSCALKHQSENNNSGFRQFDIEASIHMKIVEARRKNDKCVSDRTMPYSVMDFCNM